MKEQRSRGGRDVTTPHPLSRLPISHFPTFLIPNHHYCFFAFGKKAVDGKNIDDAVGWVGAMLNRGIFEQWGAILKKFYCSLEFVKLEITAILQ